MSVRFAPDRETSSGPLDVAHNGGADDNQPLVMPDDDTPPSDLNEPLDGNAPASDGPLMDDEELLREKNPLGYTVTEPTLEEMNQLNPADPEDSGDKGTS